MKFLDQAKVYIRSGDGGAGLQSVSGVRNMSSLAARMAAMAGAAAM